jgi:hypothetical protein
MAYRRARARALAYASLALAILVSAPAATALAKTRVRFVNAVPGDETARLVVAGSPVTRAVAFGRASGYVPTKPGRVSIAVATGEDRAGARTLDLARGVSYTVVALPRDGDPELRAFRDGFARGGDARLRTINAAPELGVTDVRVGERVIAERLRFREATPYLSLSPGARSIELVRASDERGALVSGRVALTAGTSTTTVVVGTRGEPSRLLTLADGAVAPGAAPGTGLGGGGGPSRAPVVLLAALAAGLAGGGAWWLAQRRAA